MVYDFILEQQLPKDDVALRHAEKSLNDCSDPTCPHMLSILPHNLDLTLSVVKSTSTGNSTGTAKSNGKKIKVLQSPVHALHLESQFVNSNEKNDTTNSSAAISMSMSMSILYGEEEERRLIWQTPGLSDQWHPEMKKMEPAPLNTYGGTAGTGAATAATAGIQQHSDTATPATTASASATPAATATSPDRRYWQLYTQQEQIKRMQQNYDTRKNTNKRSKPEPNTNTNTTAATSTTTMPAWKRHLKRDTLAKSSDPQDAAQLVQKAKSKSNLWLEQYRQARQAYWSSLALENETAFGDLSQPQQPSAVLTDDVFQCLECSFVGTTKDAIGAHMFLQNHMLAVTCGCQANVWCFKCGEVVQHDIFEQEKFRIDTCQQFPWMAWKEHALQRSFDALQFQQVDQGIYWKGMVATYPPLIPLDHVNACKANQYRYQLFHSPDNNSPLLLLQDEANKCRIPSPVGIFNLGNTCCTFISFQSIPFQGVVYASSF
jgi:hypothetical protein